MYCTQCGHYNAGGARYCANCGHMLRTGEPARFAAGYAPPAETGDGGTKAMAGVSIGLSSAAYVLWGSGLADSILLLVMLGLLASVAGFVLGIVAFVRMRSPQYRAALSKARGLIITAFVLGILSFCVALYLAFILWLLFSLVGALSAF